MKLPDSAANKAASATPVVQQRDVPAMIRVTFSDLSRLPVERLAKLLMERAAEDPMLLSRLHDTLAEQSSAAPPADTPSVSSTRIVGTSQAIRHVAEMIKRFVRTDEPVLITGESGTGKELAARAIHESSRRQKDAFVAVNCAAIPSNLVASELFGYEKGAFTGAHARTKGQIEHANGGTLFLDEIGDMPVDLQGHLLRFLQEGQIVRVGGRETISVDVRIVAATNVRLRQAIAEGRFREDLYYRLNVLALQLPPLRERTEDIAQLAQHFLREAAATSVARWSISNRPQWMRCGRIRWPGNVRELQSMIRRAVVIGDGPLVSVSDLVGLGDTDNSYVPQAKPLPRPGSHEEKTALLEALSRTQENVTLTAQELGVSRVTLYRMLRRHSINLSRGLKDPPVPGRVKPLDQQFGPESDATTG